VGTVSLDTGQFVLWDMTKLAREHQYQLYREVIRASAAIPVVFPAVLLPTKMQGGGIQELLYVDGAVRQNLFLPALASAMQQAYATGREGPVVSRVDAVLNGRLGLEPSCVDGKVLSVAAHSLDNLTDERNANDLFSGYAIACNFDSEFRFWTMPHDEENYPDLTGALGFAADLPEKAKRLFDSARENWNSLQQTKPPGAEQLSRVCGTR
jgi:hypothetical protein